MRFRRVSGGGCAALVFAAITTAGCLEPAVERPDAGGGSPFVDPPKVVPPPEAPVVDPIAARQPYPVITLRGLSEAKRIVVEGAGNPKIVPTLPGGMFCVDVPTPAAGAYVLQVFAQAADGQLSASPTTVNVEHDPGAPAIPGASTCAGADPAGCVATTEDCNNGRDDDCDGLRDAQDPQCATCDDDDLENNDDTTAPQVDPRRFDGLQLCPDDPDYYKLSANAGQTITARAFFVHSAAGDLDLHLLAADGVQVLDRSTSTSNDEMVTHTASTSGSFFVLVFSDPAGTNTYALDLKVE